MGKADGCSHLIVFKASTKRARQADLRKAVAVLRKPLSDRDLFKVMAWLARAQGDPGP
jgi:hypothetical protein